MSTLVTRNWSGRAFTIQGNQITAIESWIVTGASSQLLAQQQVTNSSGQPIQRGDAHPDPEYAGMTVANVNAKSIGPLAYLVSISFTLSNNVAFPLNRVLLPMEIMIDPVDDYQPMGQDINGQAIINSAQSPFDPPLTLNHSYRSFRARWYANFYDGNAATNYMDHVNSDTINIPGIGTVTPGQAWCQKYGLASAVKSTDKYVMMEVIINVRTDIQDPWQPRVIDKGRYGWYTPSTGPNQKGPFCNQDGSSFASEDVLLDGTGKPIDSSWHVYGNSAAHTPVAAPTAGAPTIDSALSTALQKTLKFIRYPSTPFVNILRVNN